MICPESREAAGLESSVQPSLKAAMIATTACRSRPKLFMFRSISFLYPYD